MFNLCCHTLPVPYKVLYVYYSYFRINNDLLLWEPTAPSPVETVESMPYGVGLSVASQLINTYAKDSFSQFRSTGPEGEMAKKKKKKKTLFKKLQTLNIVTKIICVKSCFKTSRHALFCRRDQWL